MDTLAAFSSRLDIAQESETCAHLAFPEVTDDDAASQVIGALTNEMAGLYRTGVMLGHLPLLDDETLTVIGSHLEHVIIVAMAYGMLHASAATPLEIPDDASGLE